MILVRMTVKKIKSQRIIHIKGINLSENFGQHNALMGLNYSNGDCVITLDDDLQHPPEFFQYIRTIEI